MEIVTTLTKRPLMVLDRHPRMPLSSGSWAYMNKTIPPHGSIAINEILEHTRRLEGMDLFRVGTPPEQEKDTRTISQRLRDQVTAYGPAKLATDTGVNKSVLSRFLAGETSRSRPPRRSWSCYRATECSRT